MSTPDREGLLAAHNARMRALLDGDIEALSAVVADDMLFIGPTGSTMTRDDVALAITQGTMQFLRMDCADVSTVLYGNTGVLRYAADSETRVDSVVHVSGLARPPFAYIARTRGKWWRSTSQIGSRVPDCPSFVPACLTPIRI